jgi:uncharacterized integral membrane protein
MNPKIAAIVVILTLFLIITLQNTEVSTFKILFWDIDMSRIVFIYLSVVMGFIAGFIIAKFTVKKKVEANNEKG